QAKLTNPDYGFTITDAKGHTMKIDIPADQGGHGDGLRPMQTVLAALCGCSAVDVISILKKQRQPLADLLIKVDGERQKGVEPALWDKVHLLFQITGDVEPGKASRAVQLSMEKYCSVAETLRRAGATLTWEVMVNETVVT
ncbi:MAG TPA: OsmC family protein, partial [Chitinophagaceae bacterium]|nr:OsmC family protein [Chitinophagaceae bacterium]